MKESFSLSFPPVLADDFQDLDSLFILESPLGQIKEASSQGQTSSTAPGPWTGSFGFLQIYLEKESSCCQQMPADGFNQVPNVQQWHKGAE